jgi:hypothetical protein
VHVTAGLRLRLQGSRKNCEAGGKQNSFLSQLTVESDDGGHIFLRNVGRIFDRLQAVLSVSRRPLMAVLHTTCLQIRSSERAIRDTANLLFN